MQLTTYLNFNGNCEAAFTFYAETLGGKITLMMTQGESPMRDKVPEAMKDKIMHATLEVPGGSVLMGADHPQGKKGRAYGLLRVTTGEGYGGGGSNVQRIVRRREGTDGIPEDVLVAGIRDVHR